MTSDLTELRQRAWQCVELLKGVHTLDETALSAVTYLLSHPYQWFRIHAAEALAAFAQPGTEELLAAALNDRCEHVVQEAAQALALIGTVRAVDVVSTAYLEDGVDRPAHLANALAQMGDRGYETLVRALAHSSPTLRYYAAYGLGQTLRQEVVPLLEQVMATDHAETKFRGHVSTGARKGLRILARARARASQE